MQFTLHGTASDEEKLINCLHRVVLIVSEQTKQTEGQDTKTS